MDSKGLYERMRAVTPGGVSSPIRSYPPYPVFMDGGKGCTIWDVEGNEYIDLCMAYGPLILGHSDDDVRDAVNMQLQKGSVLGAPSVPELDLIEAMSKCLNGDMVRLANSGTEATTNVLRVARGFTGRNGIAMVRGGFHGANDNLMPSRPGVLDDVSKQVHQVEYNDAEALESLLADNDDIAAFILEPVPGNMGLISPRNDYLRKVRAITEEYDTLLIFDEVITGFRLTDGCAQGYYDVKPDLTTLGKVIGGGFPVGAIAGRRDIMENVAPNGKLHMSGTFAGNPVTAAAGKATIGKMQRVGNYLKINGHASDLAKRLRETIEEFELNASVSSLGSMLQVFFGIDEPVDHESSSKADARMYDEMFRFMLKRGVYLPPSQFEVCFMSLMHYPLAMDRVVEVFREFARTVKQ